MFHQCLSLSFSFWCLVFLYLHLSSFTIHFPLSFFIYLFTCPFLSVSLFSFCCTYLSRNDFSFLFVRLTFYESGDSGQDERGRKRALYVTRRGWAPEIYPRVASRLALVRRCSPSRHRHQRAARRSCCSWQSRQISRRPDARSPLRVSVSASLLDSGGKSRRCAESLVHFSGTDNPSRRCPSANSAADSYDRVDTRSDVPF